MYPLIYHKSLTAEKWFNYPAFKQLLMIANELGRARSGLEAGDSGIAVHAWERAFELTDLTTEDPKNHHLRKEILRFRELLGEAFVTCDGELNDQLLEGLIRMDAEAYRMMTG